MSSPVQILCAFASPRRLDKALTEYFETTPDVVEVTRSQVKKLIERGHVLVNGVVASKAGVLVEDGDEILVEEFESQVENLVPYDFPLEICFEDEDLLVLNKPSGLTVHPGAGNKDRTLVNALLARDENLQDVFAGSFRPGIVHRLDKDTTGLLVVARTKAAHQALASQFAARTITRTYLALAYSTPRGKRAIDLSDSGIINEPLARDPHQKLRMAVVASGRPAETHWRVLERMNHAVFLEVHLKTGRTHQIRVHLSYLGSPLIGDPLYGDTSNLPAGLKERSEAFGRQALHAATLGFEHPTTREKMIFEQVLPPDFEELVQAFREV